MTSLASGDLFISSLGDAKERRCSVSFVVGLRDVSSNGGGGDALSNYVFSVHTLTDVKTVIIRN